MEPTLKTVTLSEELGGRVDAALAMGRSGTLCLRFEVLQIDPTGRALVWFSGPSPRIAMLQLDFQTTCETLETELPTEIVSRWAVLGRRGDRYVVAQWDAPAVAAAHDVEHA